MSTIKTKILLVEDNDDDALLTRRAFEKNNMPNVLDRVNTGEKALDYLLRRGEFESLASAPPPAVVLLDIMLPGISGLDVPKPMREHSLPRKIPVVILTSSREESDMLTSYGLGANSYVRKPIDFNEFLHTAMMLGMYWLQINETGSGFKTKPFNDSL